MSRAKRSALRRLVGPLVAVLLVVSAGRALPADELPCILNANDPGIGDVKLAQEAGQIQEQVNALAQTDPEAALAGYERVLRMLQEAKAPVGEAVTLSNIGVALRRVGRYSESLQYHSRALAMRQQVGDCGEVAVSMNNIGITLSLLNRETEAINALRTAARIRRALGDRTRLVNTLVNVALAARRLGRYDEALAAAYEALDIESGDSRSALRNVLGLIYEDTGQLSKAYAQYDEAQRLASVSGDREGVRVASLNMGTLALTAGDTEEGVQALQRSLRHSVRPVDRATALLNIAIARSRGPNPSAGTSSAEEILSIISAMGAKDRLASAHGNIGTIHLRAGDVDRARSHFEEALRLSEDPTVADKTRGIVTRSLALEALASIDERRGDFEAALRRLRHAVSLREQMRTGAGIQELRAGFSDVSFSLYERIVLLLVRTGQHEEAFHYSERARARAFVEAVLRQGPASTTSISNDLQRREQDLRLEMEALERDEATAKLRDAGPVELALQRQLSRKRDEYGRTLARMTAEGVTSPALADVPPLRVEEVQRRLPPDSALISYFVTDETSLAFVFRRDRFEVLRLEVGARDVQGAARRFRAFNAFGGIDPELVDLHRQLIAPIAARGLLQGDLVGIVPHGALHYLPFSALSDGSKFLGQDKTIFYLPSVAMLHPAETVPAAAAGSPLVLAYSGMGFEPLVNAEVEATGIARIHGASALIGATATEAALRSAAARSSVIHVAAHGVLNDAQPDFSRLVLAGGSGHDGMLNAFEIRNLPLGTVRLVVLSACQTQVGPRSLGDEVASLNRAFLQAGVAAVLASLWKVDDEASAVLMLQFHEHLHRGDTVGQALRRAQDDVRRRFPDPREWSAFVLTGNPGVGLMPARLHP